MNLELTEEQLALRDTVRRFLAEKAPVAGYVRPLLDDLARSRPHLYPAPATPSLRSPDVPLRSRGDADSARSSPTDAGAGMRDSVWRGLAELGTTGVVVPPEHGGLGMTMVEAGIVAEELGRALYPGPWLSSTVAVPRALARFDAGDAATDILTGIAKGTTIATLAVTEPPTPHGIVAPSHDLPLVATEPPAPAGPVGQAHEVRLAGTLRDVPDADVADALLVIAPHRGSAAIFAVDMSSPGVEVAAQPGVDLTRPQFRVRLDGVPARCLGAAGPEAVQAVIDDLLTAWAADALGAAQAVFELAVDYAKVRTQFGRPIGAFQAVQHLCVDMYETVELARGGVMHALWAADAASAEDRHLAAVRAKAFSGCLATVGDIAVQVFGGIGFTWEHDAHLYLRRLLGWSAFLGGPAPYLQELGAQLARSPSHDPPRP